MPEPQRRPFRPERRDPRDFALPEARRPFEALPPPVQAPAPAPAPVAAPTTTAQLAPWRRRVGAFAADFALGLGVSYVAQGLASAMGGDPAMMGYMAFFGTWLVNRGYLQSQKSGQSFGKWLFSIKAMDTETEAPPTLVRSVAREGVSSVLILTEALVVPMIADALFAAFDPDKRQSLHDRAARTTVVEAEEGFDLDEKLMGLWQELTDNEPTPYDNYPDNGSRFRDFRAGDREPRRKGGKAVKTLVEKARDLLDDL